ncbi:MAG: glycosyltransferase family 39 protein [Actinomycetota bacterium]|nr:glycosyltransferase family 39 protein [Actinomycetota bacterium]
MVASAFLGRRGLFPDEAVSIGIARSDWSSFVDASTSRETNMTLYHLILRGWVSLGHSEAFARLPSVFAAVATIPVMVAVGTRLFGRRAGVLGGLLLALNAGWLYAAQLARGYALCLFLLGMATWLFVEGVEKSRLPVWAGYGLVGAMAAYSHIFAVLVLAAHASSLVLLPKSRMPWRGICTGGAVLAAALVPLGLQLTASTASGIGWASASVGGRFVETVRTLLPVTVGALLTVALLVGTLLALPRLRRRLTADDSLRWWRLGVAAGWAFVPLLIAAAVSYFATPVLVARWFLIVVPALLMLLAVALTRMPARLRVGALVLVLALSVTSVVRWYRQGEYQEWRTASSYVAADAMKGDGVVFFAPYGRISFEYYLERFPAARTSLQPVFPAGDWGRPTIELVRYQPVEAETLVPRLDDHRRVWLLLSDEEVDTASAPDQDTLIRALELRFERRVETRFNGVTVVRFDRPTAPSEVSG